MLAAGAGAAAVAGIAGVLPAATADASTVDGALLSVPSSSKRLLIRGGHVLTFDAQRTEQAPGDVLIAGNVIVAVGSDLRRHPMARGAQLIDAGGTVVTPGFIDTHRHRWNALLRGLGADWTSFGAYFQMALTTLSAQLTPDDIATGGRLATLESLWYGTTTVLDWFHASNTPAHAAAAYQALRSSGLRGVFAYGPASIHWFDGVGPDDGSVVALHKVWQKDPGLLGFALAIRGPEFSPMSRVQSDLELARGLKIPVTMHAGIDGFWQQAPTVQLLEQAKLMGPDLTFVHNNVLDSVELDAVASSGATLSLSPVVESTLHMGTSPLESSMAAGLRPSVSTDGVTGSNADPLAQLRELARQRSAEGASVAAGELLAHVTIDAAQTLGLAKVVGSLEPGKLADLVLLTQGPNLFPGPPGGVASSLVVSGDGSNVDTVIVNGVIRKRHGALVGVDLAEERARAQAAQNRLVKSAGL